MPQAALPDLNTAWIMDKRELLQAIRHRNYTAVVGYLFAINAAIPEPYTVHISDLEYNQAKQEHVFVICSICSKECPHCKSKKGECTAEHKRSDVIVKEVMCNTVLNTITGLEHQKVWECPTCHNQQLLNKTKMVKTKIAEPHFFQVVPSPPQREGTLTDRNLYHVKMQHWAYQFYNEIAHAMSRFRLEYRPKGDELDMGDVMDGGEVLDI